MTRRFFFSIILLPIYFFCHGQDKIYVSPNGNDSNEGTFKKPLKTPGAAITRVLTLSGKDVTIEIRGGTYSLAGTLEITSADFSLRSLTIGPYSNEKVIITGSKKVNLQWEPYKNGIVRANLNVTGLPDRLFLNGTTLPMARYPNFDAAAGVFNGTAADALSEKRVKTWKNPAGGFIHALHQGEWGAFHYRITGKDEAGKLTYEGGWQNNRPAPMHKEHRFVENIFEELDAPGEWFFDPAAKAIFLYPPAGVNMENAVFTISSLTDLIHITGNADRPIKNISIKNISFTQTARSFMLVKEPLLRSDWTIYRGGAILLDGTENVRVSNCVFYELGGNAVFVSNYNKNDTISDNHLYDIGANGIAFVGNADAVRSPAFRYELFVPWKEMDYAAGPKNNNFPQYCTASGNLVHHIGMVEKQIAGVEIDMAAHITVSHNTIYHTPRAGINIGDGCWGGHVLEFNDVFSTVLETGDHGAFNSWGRDRFWRPERPVMDSVVAARPGIELLDAVDPTIIRNNRFQCDHGWDIDLDDGSSNYRIYNNVCLNGGLKLREGYHRRVTNNILVNNTFHPHVWLKKSGDVFLHNIVTTAYAPILMDHWGALIDSNFFLTKDGLAEARALNLDQHSSFGDALFMDVIAGNYRVKAGSKAMKTGFKNFDLNVGVTLPALKKIAGKPPIKPLLTSLGEIKGIEVEWLGGMLKNIESPGERSAAGLHDNNGALLVQVPANSLAAKNNLQKGDVIIKMGGQVINSVSDLLQTYQSIKWMGRVEVTIVRNQSAQPLIVSFK
jgi:Right handed beta helix region/PDZ domain